MTEERIEKDESTPIALKEELAEAKKYYIEKNSTVKVKSVLSKDGFFYASDDETYKIKHDFIVDLVGAANEKEDSEFQTYLKDFAKQFDEKLNGSTNDSLFLGLITAYPGLLSKSDLKWMVDSVKGKKDKFVSLCNFILSYIDPEKEPNACGKDSITDEEILKRFNFIWEVFKAIKSYGESWAKIGEIYLDSLFGDDYVSFGIFTPRFFKKRRAKNFIFEVNKYCAKYLKGSRFDLHSTEIYEHYRQTKKAEKKRNVIIAVASVVAVVGIAAGTLAFLKSANTSTIEFHGNASVVISYVYGTSPNLDDWYITYKNHDGTEHKVQVTEKMLSGVDQTKIGVQQQVTITYRGATYKGLQIRIDPATLATPEISRKGTDITWDAIPNATGYEIYITDNEITGPQGAPAATVAENETSFNVAAVCKSGKYNVYVRAVYTGKGNDSGNAYKNSSLSAGVKIEKIGTVASVEYSNGTLKWAAIGKADKYDISINGVAVAEGITSPSYSYVFKGGEKIVIAVKSNDETIYSSSAEFTVLNCPDVSFDGTFVSWAGGALYNVSITDSSGTEKVRINEKTDVKAEISALGKGVYTVSVQTVGGGSNVSSPERKVKFAVGYDVTIDKSDGRQIIKWDDTDLGNNFKIIVNGTERGETNANEYTINSGFENAGIYTVSVVATDENVYLASVTLTKLAAPELIFDKTRKTWSDISVKAGQTVVYTVNGDESLSLPTDFVAGRAYEIAVYVKTDNKNEINSNTATVSVYKFNKPSIRVDYTGADKFVYDNAESGVTLECYYVENGTERVCDVNNITAGRTYSVYGRLAAETYKNYTFVLDSDNGDPIEVGRYGKPNAPEYHLVGDTLTVDDLSDGYIFYYKRSGSSEYTALSGNSVGGLKAGKYDVCAAKNGKFEGGIYFLRSTMSDSTEVTLANISFTVTYMKSSGAAVVTFDADSDAYDFTYTVTIWKGDSSTTTEEKQGKWNQLIDKSFRIRITEENVTGISVTITMNGISTTRTWGVTE